MPGSVFVLTLHKAGSQWVRDVLWDADVLALCGLERGRQGVNGQHATTALDWPTPADGLLHAPVYSIDMQTWIAQRRPDDRAVVVLRDPRDIVVSFVPSITTSHKPTVDIDRLRSPFRRLERREQLLAGFAWLERRVPILRSWAGRTSTTTEFVTSYEALIADQHRTFAAIVEFLGADGDDPAVAAAVDAHSFTTRSGREPGTTDPHSHYRRGVAGDWRHHFDRTTGELFEALFPGLLEELGHERSADWWQDLPDETSVDEPEHFANDDLLVELRRVQEENLMLRLACDDRLTLIEQLNARLTSPAPITTTEDPNDHDEA